MTKKRIEPLSLQLKEIAQEHLRSFIPPQDPYAEEQTEDDQEETLLLTQADIKKGRLGALKVASMTDREEQELIFEQILFQSTTLKKDLKRNHAPVLDKESMRDMSLLCGHDANPNHHVHHKINKTQTAMGSSVLATELANPHAEVKTIQKKQAFREKLLENPAVFEKLKKKMARVKQAEKVRLSWWKEETMFKNPLYQKELNKSYFSIGALKGCNKSAWLLQGRKVLNDVLMHPLFLIYIAYAFFVHPLMCLWKGEDILFRPIFFFIIKFSSIFHPEESMDIACEVSFIGYIINSLHNFIVVPFSELLFPRILLKKIICFIGGLKLCVYPDLMPELSFHEPSAIIDGFSREENYMLMCIGIYFFYVYMSCLFLYQWINAYRAFSLRRGVYYFLAEHMAPFQDLVLAADAIHRILALHPALEKLYGGQLVHTRKLLTSTKDQELAQLVQLLKKTRLRKRWFFFHGVGNMLIAYRLLKDQKEKFIECMYELARLDVALSMATLMQETTLTTGESAFVHGQIEEAPKQPGETPRIVVEDMWNIFLDPNSAVPNSVALGKNRQDGRLMIITGPNAGGKSTYILGIGCAVILHQCFGLSPSRSLEQVLFTRIITYVNPTQNLAEGLSLAQAGIKVLRKHKQVLETCKQPILAIIDEILNGTDPDVAEELSYKVLEKRHVAFPQCITLMTTHFMKLTKLEKKHADISNRKVVVVRPGKNGKTFDYTYKIEPGISDQNIVEEMLIEKGII